MKIPLIAALMLLPLPAALANEKARGFSVDALKSLGLSPDIAEYFKDEKRFMEGKTYVTLFVNGSKLGRALAVFDNRGQLCVTRDLLARASIAGKDPSDQQGCIDLRQLYPQAIIKLRPGREEVELIVPPEAIRNEVSRADAGFATGGTAGIFNYDMLYMKSNSGFGSSSALQGGTELGLNIDSWVVRSRQAYSSSSRGGTQFSHLDAYAQTTLPQHKSVVQFGQINAANSMFSSPPLLGLQFFPENALLQQGGDRVSVNGIAQMEARVEVRQSGVLIYSTTVPAGPFTLAGLTLNNANTDLEVTVIEGNGAERRFVVPASSFAIIDIPRERSFSVALGKPWNYGGADAGQKDDALMLISRAGVPVSERIGMSVGMMNSASYHSLGTQWSAMPTRSVALNLNHLVSYVPRTGDIGMQMAASGYAQLHKSLSVGANYSLRGSKFRTYSDATRVYQQPQDSPWAMYRDAGTSDAGVSANYSNPTIGAVGASYSRYSGGGANDTRRVTLNWGQSFGRINTNVSIERSTGALRDTTLYARLSLPIGRSGSLSGNVMRNDRRVSGGLSYNDQINDYASYSVSTQTDSDSRQVGTAGSLSVLPRFAQVNMNMARHGAGSSSSSARISGGVVAHAGGLTFSPYQVRDTFALISIPGMSGIKVHTPAGPVWTDYKGSAVAASMPAYSETRLEMATKGLPKNVDVKNGIQTTGLGRGAVGQVAFEVSRMRRVLLKLRGGDNAPLTKGQAVYTGEGKWLTSVSNDGTIFVTGEQLADNLEVRGPNGFRCGFDVSLPENPTSDVMYEKAEAVCRPAG